MHCWACTEVKLLNVLRFKDFMLSCYTSTKLLIVSKFIVQIQAFFCFLCVFLWFSYIHGATLGNKWIYGKAILQGCLNVCQISTGHKNAMSIAEPCMLELVQFNAPLNWFSASQDDSRKCGTHYNTKVYPPLILEKEPSTLGNGY